MIGLGTACSLNDTGDLKPAILLDDIDTGFAMAAAP
jgi:hypothetical protein